MNRIFTLLAILVVTFAGCSAKTETSSTTMTTGQKAGDFTVATSFSPDPPKQGSETIVVTVMDDAGAPVKGASVKIATNMPAMSMAGPNLTGSDNGDGTYAVQTNLNYATQWTFDVTISANGKSGVLHVTKDIK